MIPPEWIDQAWQRVGKHLEPTPLEYDPSRQLYLKWENRQVTGSFKLRGALAKVLGLPVEERSRGLITASAGNHGQGVAWAARLSGTAVTVFSSEQAVPAKIEAMKALGAQVILVPGGYALAEETAQRYAAERQAVWVSPYNDGMVISGQATLAVEILKQLDGRRSGAWIVPVGGGGLLAGTGAVLAKTSPRPILVGVQSQASPYFEALFHRGTQSDVREEDSLADGLAGAVEAGSITIPLVRSLADDIRLVSEEQIAAAIAYAWHAYRQRVEGSAAAALAAALFEVVEERPAVVVITGGNIQPALHARICAQYALEGGAA